MVRVFPFGYADLRALEIRELSGAMPEIEMLREEKLGRRGRFANALIIAGLLVMILAAPKLCGQSEKAPPATEPVPFAAGEVLDYRLTWSVFSNAAAVQLAVVEKRDLFGIPTWHFRASAHTQVPLRALAEIDDQFDSYAEIATLESRQYETYLNELGEKQNTVLQLVAARQLARGRASVVLVKPHTRDPLAALYMLRAIDWQKTREIREPVYDGEDLYEMRARLELSNDVISIAGQNVMATKVAVVLFRGGYESRTRCWIWFSRDAARVPVMIQAQVPYGGVRAELVSRR
jgi:hypothetical protein